MHFLKTIQWLLGFVITFYVYRALLGKFADGDGVRVGMVAVALLAIALATSGLIKIN